MENKQFTGRIVIGIIGLFFLIIGIVFVLSKININQSQKDIQINENISTENEDKVAVDNPIRITGSLYNIELTEADTEDFHETMFVPVKKEYIGNEKYTSIKQYNRYVDITEGIEVNVSTIYRYDRVTSNELFDDLIEINKNNFDNNSYVSDYSISERISGNGQAYQFIDFKEKTFSGTYENTQKIILLKTTNNSNIFIKYEIVVHPELRTEKTESLLLEIKNYLNIK